MSNGESLLAASRRVLGEALTMKLLRATFFGHFCAGETAADAKNTVQTLRTANINAIMDYAAEADVQVPTGRLESVHVCASNC